MSGTDILKHFPNHLKTPRQAQIDILKSIQASWDTHDVFIVNAPVALGKSAIASTIAEWSGDACIITPSNLLRNQYYEEYPSLHVVRARKEYWCTTTDMTVDARFKRFKKLCITELKCEGCIDYLQMKEDITNTSPLLANYYGYLAYSKQGAFKSTLIIDEAHNLVGMLRSLAGHRVWQHDAKYPDGLKTRLDLMAWAQTIPESKLETNETLKLLKQQLLADKPSYLFQITRDYHGIKAKHLPVIKMLPVDTRGLKQGEWFIWPTGVVRKLVLMSGTITKFDIDSFGLKDYRVKYIEADSPIPPAQRPVIIPNVAKSMAFKDQAATFPEFVEFIKDLAQKNVDSKGLIHIPYAAAEVLRSFLGDDPRFLFHDRLTKLSTYRQFRESTEPKILVASGMYEGIDLPGDLCRWQVIAKIPYPSLADPALRWMARKDNRWYAWQSIKDTLQASGRVCRNPSDYGETYIYDSCFNRLFEQNRDLFPMWFQKSLKWSA